MKDDACDMAVKGTHSQHLYLYNKCHSIYERLYKFQKIIIYLESICTKSFILI